MDTDDLGALSARVTLLRRALDDAERRQRAGETVPVYALAGLLDAAFAALLRGLRVKVTKP